MSRSFYFISQYRSDPLGFLIELMHLKAHEKQLRQAGNSLYLLTGILTYRCLPRSGKTEVTTSIYNVMTSRNEPHEIRMTMGHLYGVISNLSANPHWYCWSLTDQELREYYNVNKSFSGAIEALGLDIDVGCSVSALAAGILAASKKGLRTTLAASIRSRLNMGLAASIGKPAGQYLAFSLAMVTVFAGVMHAMTSESAQQGRRELMARGLLRLEEI